MLIRPASTVCSLERKPMMEIEKLRKADVFSGTLVVLLGVFIVAMALQMPMKDSYGGVQNVWYVSPALFPILVGGMLVILGGLLMKTALMTIGLAGVHQVMKYLFSSDFLGFLKKQDTLRFYGIVLNLIILVFLLVPRVDFFLAATIFLLIFFFMFYCGTDTLLTSLIFFTLGGALFFCLFTLTPLAEIANSVTPFAADILIILMIIGLLVFGARQVKNTPDLRKKFRLSIIIGFIAPMTIGIIFKYFLLVPMPFEGIVVSMLDGVWYADIWSQR